MSTNLEPEEHEFEEISEGEVREQVYLIDDAVYSALVTVFQDRSPIHVSHEVARNSGMKGCVMHGAILNGFLSHFIGMVFPGATALLLSVDLRYIAPSYLGDKITLRAKVKQKVESQSCIVLALTFFNSTQEVDVARGSATVRVKGVSYNQEV